MVKIIALATVGTIVAEAASPGEASAAWWAPLVNTGAIGCVLIWFMLRAEPRFRAIEASIDRVSRVLSLAIIAMRSCDAVVKEQAEEIVRELNAKESAAKKTA